MPDRSLFINRHGLHPLVHPTADGSNAFEPGEVEVEVEVDGAWVRGLAHARRCVAGRWEVQVSSLNAAGDTGPLAPGWFGSDRIRAVHIGKPNGQPLLIWFAPAPPRSAPPGTESERRRQPEQKAPELRP